MPIEHGDIAAGEGDVGRVVGIDGPKVRIKLFAPDDQPNMDTAVVTIGPNVKGISKGSPADDLAASFTRQRHPTREPGLSR